MFGNNEKRELKIIEDLVENSTCQTRLISQLIKEKGHIPKEHSIFTFLFLNYKISAMNAVLTVPTGTPVTGFNFPDDAKGNKLPDAAYKVGSCKYSILPNADGSVSGATVAPGSREEAFIATETNPGTASVTLIAFDAQDVNGVQLPQSTGTLTFTATPAVATGSTFNFDQTSH